MDTNFPVETPSEDPFAISSDALPPTLAEDVNYLEELVGENKKFKDVNALAKSKAEADRYIALLKRQIEDKEKELSTRASLEAFLTEIKSQTKEEPVTDPLRSPEGTPPSQAPVLDDSVIAAKVAEVLRQRELESAAAKNLASVKQALVGQFGENAARVLHNKAQEANLSVKELQELAARSPTAFFRLTGLSATPTNHGNTPAIPTSAVDTGLGNPLERGKKYYDKLKQTDPDKYNAPETTSQMMKDMARLGRDRFYNS